MRLLHLSDSHLRPSAGPEDFTAHAVEALQGMLTDLEQVRAIDAVVVSGDVADDGSVEAYEAVRSIIGTFAADRGIPAIYSTGNHDERNAFTEVLGSGHLDASGDEAAAEVFAEEGERAAVSVIDGFRIVTLDSLIPGKIYGRIGADQLAWLREVLAEPSERGSVVVFHHPPFSLDDPVQSKAGLRNPGELAEALRGADVGLILCGHYHLQLFGHLESIPVWVGPAVVSRIDMTSPAGARRIVRGAAATLVELGTAISPLFHTYHARDPRAGELIHEANEAELAPLLEEGGALA